MRGWRAVQDALSGQRFFRPDGDPGQKANAGSEDELAAELADNYWRLYHKRMQSVGLRDMARQLPSLVGQAVGLAWEAGPATTVGTIVLNVASGASGGYALFATNGALSALLAGGPTLDRVRAAVPALVLIAVSSAMQSALSVGAGFAQARLQPQVSRAAEVKFFDLTTKVELGAYDDADFHERMQRARDRGMFTASDVVNDVIGCLTGITGIASAAVVIGVLQPLLLVLLLAAQLPGAWSAVRSARIRYVTQFALTDASRRKWILATLMADRRTAAELRSFTMRPFLLSRLAQLASYQRDARLVAARQTTVTRVIASAAGGVTTGAVYIGLGLMLIGGWLPLSAAGTAVLAIRSAGGSLQQFLFAVNSCYEDGLYFGDYLAFCTDAADRVAAGGAAPPPAGFDQIEARGVSFSYPGTASLALDDVTVTIGRGEVVALVGENGSGKTTLAKLLAGLYRPTSGTLSWDGKDLAATDLDKLREQVAVVAQDHANWPLSVRHNITMGRGLDEERMVAAAVASGADTVIEGLVHGYDTLLARQFKDGAELSGGQWQRIAAARAFYRTAPLLIMDEPTAALDARAEYALFSTLRVHAATRSVLLITHRLASVRQADRIYVLAHGKLAEQGTHEELMALGGQYAELFTLQASQYED
jgi:ATP-binding cassette, subfamily B, bacterial